MTNPVNTPPKVIVLSWNRTIKMCWGSVCNRIGRSAITFLGIAVVTAFFMSSFCYQSFVSTMVDTARRDGDVHVKATLERAGVFTHDVESQERQRDQRMWLIALSVILCLTGITNTILMSVTERVREIGTLKCLGALDSFVVRLFLVENLFLGMLGSAAGTLAGFLLTVLQIGYVFEFSLLSIGQYARVFAFGMPIAAGAGTTLTVLAAIYPAYVAARMKPVDAMRAEV
jgi:putative ABC transport system permease protein